MLAISANDICLSMSMLCISWGILTHLIQMEFLGVNNPTKNVLITGSLRSRVLGYFCTAKKDTMVIGLTICDLHGYKIHDNVTR